MLYWLWKSSEALKTLLLLFSQILKRLQEQDVFKSLSHSALLNCFVRLGVGYFLHLITFTHFYFLFFLNNHFYCTLALLPQMLKPSKCDFAPGRAPWHLQVGMLSCFLMLAMFCKAITRKAFAKRCVGTTNLKAPCARENLPKTFLINLLEHFVPAISANIYLAAVPGVLAGLLGISVKSERVSTFTPADAAE